MCPLSSSERDDIEWKPVTTLYSYDDDRLTTVVTLVNAEGEQEIFEVTSNHPFYVDGKGWVDVEFLEGGMQVPEASGELLTVVGIETQNSSPVTYNIEVAEDHTYFVGELGAWVHNENNPGCDCSSLDVGLVDTYANAKKKRGDGIVHRDHQPSKQALKQRAEEIKGEPLTPAEAKRIEEDALTVNVNENVHRAGPTYGGKNKPERYRSDACNLSAAACRDADAMVDNAKTMDPDNIQKYEEAAKEIKKMTNEQYDNWLNIKFDIYFE